jgi:hypothetical protein
LFVGQRQCPIGENRMHVYLVETEGKVNNG